MTRRGKRTLLIVGGVAGAGAITAFALAARSRQGVGATNPPPAAGSLQLVGLRNLSGAPGSPLTGMLVVRDTGGGQSAVTTVQATVTLTAGQSSQQLAAQVDVPALPAGQTAAVPFRTSAPISPQMTGSVQVVVTAMSQTITGTLAVAANPASFQFGESSVGTIDASVGDVVSVDIPVKNVGGTTGTPTVTGTTALNGTVEGHWTQETSPSIAPGQTASVKMSTSSAIASMFAGDSLQISFSVSP